VCAFAYCAGLFFRVRAHLLGDSEPWFRDLGLALLHSGQIEEARTIVWHLYMTKRS